MQAVDQRTGTFGSDSMVRAMAIFGTIVAIVLIAGALLYGGVVVAGALAPRAATTSLSDQLAQHAVISFRNSEHAAAAASLSDQLAQPAVISFRNSEHAAAAKPWTGDPLSQPSLVEFRNSEHASAR